MVHRKLSCQTRMTPRPEDNAYAAATARELTRKYISAAAINGCSGDEGKLPYLPPSPVYAMPAAATLAASVAMLNSVLCAGLRTLIRNVACDQPLATAISIVGAGPSSSRAVKSTA